MKSIFKRISGKQENNENSKKIENIIFLIVILVVTLIIMNIIWKDGKNEDGNINTKSINATGKVLASGEKEAESNLSKDEFEQKLENILSTIKNVGEVKVLINYSESSSIVPIYNESTTVSTQEEGDSSGGTRTSEETQTQKDVVFSESSGNKEPVTQKTLKPEIQGAIITAKGAKDAVVRTNIVNAVVAITGLTADKVQVFEMKE